MAKSKRSAEREAFWRLVLEEFQQSGLTVRAFCQREGVSQPSFYAWRRTIHKRDAGERDAARGRQDLIPVDVVDPVEVGSPYRGESSSLELLTPSGFTFRFPQDIEPRRLDALLGVIAQCNGAASC